MNNKPKLLGQARNHLRVLQLRVQDVDFGQGLILVCGVKGDSTRRTMLPEAVRPFLQDHLQNVPDLHEYDLQDSYGSLYL